MGMKEIIRFHAVAYSKASISKKTAIIDGRCGGYRYEPQVSAIGQLIFKLFKTLVC